MTVSATLTARACLERQRVARGERSIDELSFSAGGGQRLAQTHYMCRDCAVGRDVARRVTS